MCPSEEPLKCGRFSPKRATWGITDNSPLLRGFLWFPLRVDCGILEQESQESWVMPNNMQEQKLPWQLTRRHLICQDQDARVWVACRATEVWLTCSPSSTKSCSVMAWNWYQGQSHRWLAHHAASPGSRPSFFFLFGELWRGHHQTCCSSMEVRVFFLSYPFNPRATLASS